MKSADISDALGMLDEEILRHTDFVRNKGEKCSNAGKRKCRHRIGGRWKRWYAMAAGFCIICLIALANLSVLWSQSTVSFQVAALESVVMPDSLRTFGNLEELGDTQGFLESLRVQDSDNSKEPFVPVSDLLASADPGSDKIMELAAVYARVPIGEYTGIYEKDSSADGGILADSIGRKVDGVSDWYYISGHNDLQYLIQKENESYFLWKFCYFDSEEYPYLDVLELVYRIESADGIRKIEVQPPKMDNTYEGKKIQEEIGNRTITDRDEIAAIYQVLCTMTCYGDGRWDLIDYGNAEAAADGESSHNAVRLGRYLSLGTDYGNEIDGLKYTAVSGMFYEFSGIAYNRLTEEQAESINNLLGIFSPVRNHCYPNN